MSEEIEKMIRVNVRREEMVLLLGLCAAVIKAVKMFLEKMYCARCRH